jgi:hypothetical protein
MVKYIQKTGISVYYCYPVLVVPEHLSNINLLGFVSFIVVGFPDPDEKCLYSLRAKINTLEEYIYILQT